MNISDLIELRVSSRPELGNLYWPKYDQGCWSYMHQYPLGQEFFDELMSHVSDRSIMVQAGEIVGSMYDSMQICLTLCILSSLTH